MKNLIIFILLLPLSSFLISCIFGRYLGTFGVVYTSIFNICCALIISIFLFLNISFTSIIYIELWQWVTLVGFDIFFSLRYDSLTAIMFLVVTLISSCVHIYSWIYMYTDPYLSRFMSYLSLFTFFMLILVASSNFLVLFLGWEGVGLCSYLLIGFWYTRFQAGKAATKAFLLNKIGDLFFLVAISGFIFIFHTVDFATLSLLVIFCPDQILNILTFCLLIGAVGKSAQIGLHTWLPDAMEGPTPVSALIHAATMVTAGVFLIIRCSFIFEYTPYILYLITLWGGLTSLIAGLIGSTQNDIKKIIAYSTSSQLGYMILACGLSNYNISLFHLLNHAFFKALLFLSAGSIIHILNNEQDIRKMGGFIKLSPFIYINMLIASLALIGFPFFSGYYSKDLIIESSNTKFWIGGQIIYWFTITSAILTIIYSFRLLEQVFWGDYAGSKIVLKFHTKITNIEIVILSTLTLLSLISGYYYKDLFSGLGSNFFNITIVPLNWSIIETEFISANLKLLPLFFSIFAGELNNKLFECKWFYNEIINGYIALPVLILSRHYFEQYEKYLLEYNGPLFIYRLFNR